MNRRTRPDSDESEQQGDQENSFRVKGGINLYELKSKAFGWIQEQVPLFEAFFLAVGFHVLLFPLIWFMGWALPWPKSPTITTVIEINLEHWPKVATPEKIEEIYKLPMHKE